MLPTKRVTNLHVLFPISLSLEGDCNACHSWGSPRGDKGNLVARGMSYCTLAQPTQLSFLYYTLTAVDLTFCSSELLQFSWHIDDDTVAVTFPFVSSVMH
jgi:hypothetical protein